MKCSFAAFGVDAKDFVQLVVGIAATRAYISALTINGFGDAAADERSILVKSFDNKGLFI